MIFVTVGTQLPFDRLIAAVDEWHSKKPDVAVFAQIGPARTLPRHIRFTQFLQPSEADCMFRDAELIVSHAGMGSILTALKYKKPIIIVPRIAALGEHRNEHQLATAQWLKGRSGLFVAFDKEQLHELLAMHASLMPGGGISEFADEELINGLRRLLG